MAMAVQVISEVVEFVVVLGNFTDISSAVTSTVFKTVGISLVAKLAADICRDAGQASTAAGIEITAAAASMYVALPLMKSVLSMLKNLI